MNALIIIISLLFLSHIGDADADPTVGGSSGSDVKTDKQRRTEQRNSIDTSKSTSKSVSRESSGRAESAVVTDAGPVIYDAIFSAGGLYSHNGAPKGCAEIIRDRVIPVGYSTWSTSEVLFFDARNLSDGLGEIYSVMRRAPNNANVMQYNMSLSNFSVGPDSNRWKGVWVAWNCWANVADVAAMVSSALGGRRFDSLDDVHRAARAEIARIYKSQRLVDSLNSKTDQRRRVAACLVPGYGGASKGDAKINCHGTIVDILNGTVTVAGKTMLSAATVGGREVRITISSARSESQAARAESRHGTTITKSQSSGRAATSADSTRADSGVNATPK